MRHLAEQVGQAVQGAALWACVARASLLPICYHVCSVDRYCTKAEKHVWRYFEALQRAAQEYTSSTGHDWVIMQHTWEENDALFDRPGGGCCWVGPDGEGWRSFAGFGGEVGSGGSLWLAGRDGACTWLCCL